MQYEVRKLSSGFFAVVFIPTGMTVETLPTLKLAQNTARQLAARYGAKKVPRCPFCGEYLLECPCET